MKGKRFSDEKITGILQEGETGVSEAKRFRELERENAEPKKIVTEQTLDIRMLKDVTSKMWRAWRNIDVV